MNLSRLLAVAGVLVMTASLVGPWIIIPLGGQHGLFAMQQRFDQPVFALAIGYILALCLIASWALWRSRPRVLLVVAVTALITWSLAFGLYKQQQLSAIEMMQQQSPDSGGLGLAILHNMQLGWGAWAPGIAALMFGGAFFLHQRRSPGT